MKLTRIEVEHFGCIRRASVELGPGLNVLFGPNDLGKSTLARAVRAALLLPHTSSAAQEFIEWDSDENPFVKLTIELPDRRIWRVEKRFGTSGGSSILRESTDGQTFSPYKKAREVDDEVRSMLGWGIASPATKGAPRGLPTSFLAQVLLGEQADVAGVLQATIDEHDTDESGRQRLTGALAAFAQDPLFKSILEKAQGNVGLAFTATGKKKRGKASPFREVTDEVKRVKEELERLAKRVDESENARRELESCNADLLKWQEAKIEAGDRRDRLREAKAQLEARRAVERELEAARELLEGQRAEVATLGEKEELLATTKEEVEAARAQRDEAAGEAEELGAKERAAEDALRRAKSDEAEQARQIRRGELEKRSLELGSALEKLEAERSSHSKARALQSEIANAEKQADALEGRRGTNERALEAASTEKRDAEGLLELLDVATRLQDKRRIEGSIGELERVAADIEADRATAAEHHARARTLLEGISSDLPDKDTIATMQQLAHDLEVAEAKLGGGLAVTVERLQPVAMAGTADGAELEVSADGRVSFEALRAFTLRIGDVAKVTVTAGEKEAREQEAGLRERWSAEVVPALERAKAADLPALAERVHNAETLRSQAKEAETTAAALLERAATREERLSRLPALRHELAAIDRELQGQPIEQAAELLDSLADVPIADRRAEAKRRLSSAEEGVNAARKALGEASAESSLVAERLARAEKDFAELGVTPPVQGWDELDSRLAKRAEELLLEQRTITTELESLVAEQGAEIRAAEAELARAREAVAAGRTKLDDSTKKLDVLREQASRLEGELENRRAAVAKLDVEAASERFDEISSRLEALPVPVGAVTDEELQQAERDVESAQREFDRAHDVVRKAEGALQTVGGQVVLEEQATAKDALRQAERKEREVELEYDAWRLLVDKLREAENTEGQHLGEALSQPVTERFAKLTTNRYGKLEVGPNLKAEGLRVAGVLRDVRALSVGTQEQLAALLRLTVAEHLQTTLVLDDHLTQTDPARSAWFREVLREHSSKTQVIVLTCRPPDYLREDDLPPEGQTLASRAGGLVRVIDLGRAIERASTASTEGGA